MSSIPAYMKIRNHVVDMVISHSSPNMRIMSERELCAKFDVTRPTARKALKDLIDDGWLNIRPGKGMFVNPSAISNNLYRSSKIKCVVIVMSDGKMVDLDPFHMDILATLLNTFKTLEVRVKIANISGDPQKLDDELMAYAPDGVIWLRPPEKLLTPISRLQKKLPIHAFGNLPSGKDASTTMDYRKAGSIAAAWFLDKGRKRAVITSGRHAKRIKDAILSGWRAEFASRDIEFDNSLLLDADHLEKVEGLLKNGPVEGLFCFSTEYPFIAKALAKAKIPLESVPVLVDENQYPLRNVKPKPSAKLILFPPELPELAARRLCESLENPSAPCPELILTPSIKEY